MILEPLHQCIHYCLSFSKLGNKMVNENGLIYSLDKLQMDKFYRKKTKARKYAFIYLAVR